MKYCVYLLLEKKPPFNVLYIGCTSNLQKRYNAHKKWLNFPLIKILKLTNSLKIAIRDELLYLDKYKPKMNIRLTKTFSIIKTKAP